MGICEYCRVCALCFIMLVGSCYSKAAASERVNRPLAIDDSNGIKVFWAGMMIMPSVAGSFEFYQYDLKGNRKRILLSDFQKKHIKARLPSSASGHSAKIHHEFQYNWVDENTIDLHFRFTTPPEMSGLRLEIIKLFGDLFKGAVISAIPPASTDRQSLPVEPLPFAERVIATGKNAVKLDTGLFCMELIDLQNTKSIDLADFRNVSWDKYKSFYFYMNQRMLLPSTNCSFDYRIRILPSTAGRLIKSDLSDPGTASVKKNDIRPWAFFPVKPKEAKRTQGAFDWNTCEPAIYAWNAGEKSLKILQTELLELTGRKFNIHMPAGNIPENAICIGRPVQKIKKETQVFKEGYGIAIEPKQILITSSSARGCLYGIYTLLQKLSENIGNQSMNCGNIQDWPDLETRGHCIEMLQPEIRDIGLFKRYIEVLSRARVNTVLFYHEPEDIAEWAGGNTSRKYWSINEIKEVVDYARSLHMDVWAGMKHKFDRISLPCLLPEQGSNLYDVNNPKAYDCLFRLYQTIINVYQPSVFLIGHDEIRGLSIYSQKSGLQEDLLFAGDVSKIRTWLMKNKIHTAMWGDMLLSAVDWAPKTDDANSLNPVYNSGPTHRAIDVLPRDVQILDWHYEKYPDYPTLAYFGKFPYTVFGCSWYDKEAAMAMAASAKKYGAKGVFSTNWGFWKTLSPAATTLMGNISAWSPVPQSSNSESLAIAAFLRKNRYHEMDYQHPISLKKAFNDVSVDLVPNDGLGFFDLGGALDLRNMPSGEKKYNGITFDFQTPGQDGKKNCIAVGGGQGDRWKGQNSVRIADLGFSADSIAFLHTCIITEPGYKVRKLGDYQIEYETGRTVSMPIVEGWNITDMRSSIGLRQNDWSFSHEPDLLIGSERAWKGESVAGMPVNVQMCIWDNSYPSEKIKQIRIALSEPGPTAKIVLLAMTALQNRK